MSAAKFTPGPWTSHGWDVRGTHGVMVAHAVSGAIASTTAYYSMTDAEAGANADLIASAPELYAALENLCKSSNSQELWDSAREALAKARGGK